MKIVSYGVGAASIGAQRAAHLAAIKLPEATTTGPAPPPVATTAGAAAT